MNTTFTINVQGEIRLPDIALLAQAMMGKAPSEAPAVPTTPLPTTTPAQQQHAVTPTPAPQAAPTTYPTTVAAASPMTAPVPAPSAPAPSAPAPSPAIPMTPATEAPKYSIDDIARAGAELAQQGPDKIAALTGLLQQFGLQAVTQLRTEQMGPFVMALRGMGARI